MSAHTSQEMSNIWDEVERIFLERVIEGRRCESENLDEHRAWKEDPKVGFWREEEV